MDDRDNLQEPDPQLDDILRQLDKIQPGADAPAIPQTTAPGPFYKGSGYSFKAPDPNDPDIIIHEVKLTRYDKASRKLRDLLAKREAISSDHSSHSAVALDYQIERAREAVKRAESDVARRFEAIEKWRGEAGREEYNKDRRKVRDNPNADLSGMSEADKKQRKQDQTNDSKWIARRREAGIPEATIQAELVLRIRAREAKRAEQIAKDDELARMEALEHFGIV